MMFSSISQVVTDGLCTGCGTCVSICPNNGIKMKLNNAGLYIPIIYENKCIRCGMCESVCPGRSIDFDDINLKLFGQHTKNILIGNYQNLYTGYSCNEKIRYGSSSGGLITHLLIYALDKKIIDGVLVTRMKKDNPIEPEAFIARTKKEIIDSSKSKYCPVPANIALKTILGSKEDERYAVVGLPCHIQGIRKLEQVCNEAHEKIILHLGLICNHAPNMWGTKLLLKRLNIKERDIIKLEYRGNGWPGYLTILRKDNRSTNISLRKYWSFLGSHFFYPPRCLLCSDYTCELADASFGDAWGGISDKNERQGTSLVISRNKIAENLLHEMRLEGEIDIKIIDDKQFVSSQIGNFYFRKMNINARNKLFKNVPKFDNIMDNSDYLDLSLALIPYLASNVSLYPGMQNALVLMPSVIFKIYNLFYLTIVKLKGKRELKGYI